MTNKLLYVLDDSSVSRHLLEKKFKDSLFKVDVVTFATSEEFFEAYIARKPDIVVVDFYLKQKLTSPAVIRRIRDIDQSTLIINITSDENPEVAMQAIKAGANNCSFKRDFDRITSMIKNHLRIRSKLGDSNNLELMLRVCTDKRKEQLCNSPDKSMCMLLKEEFVTDSSSL